MNKTRVAFFVEILIDDFDGASRTMYQIINRIDKSQFEFLFICGVLPNHEFDHEIFKCPTITVPINASYSMAIPQFKSSSLKKKLKSFNPDVIHIATPAFLGTWALNFAKNLSIPVISIYHTHFISYAQFYLRNFKFLLSPVESSLINKTKNFYSKCDLVYVPTEEMIKSLKEIGMKGDNFKLWKRGISTALFNPNKRDETYIKNIVKNDNKNILFVSRLVWEKNLKTLEAIYKKSESLNLNYNFILVGDGVAKASLEKSMPNAYFLGTVEHEELSKIYASSDLFLFPSVTEAYGNVVIEAMASGIPSVAADGGGPKSFVNEGENGFLISPYDVDAYLNTIKRIFEDKELHDKIVSNGLNSTSSMGWEKLVEGYFYDIQNLYSSIPSLLPA